MEMKENAILEGLNPEQSAAVQSVDGPVLIVAGAGSGKTRVLTSRVAYILASGVEPSKILALTFTKKAAGEMKERIALMVGANKARRVVMGTFHSIFVRFLREYAGSLGYPESFTIYDTSDSTSAVKACIKELALDDKIYKPKEILGRISKLKNGLWTPSSYRANKVEMDKDFRAKKPRFADVFDLYQRKLKDCGVMDFDDILLNMNILFRDNKEALAEIASRFSHIMVDEYQDTNYAQYLILKKLAQPHHNICVVGDDSQSIYAFRGAKIENILKFRKDYPESKTYRLERNYRSTSTIVDAANSVIAHNENRIPKTCYSEAGDGELIPILHSYAEGEEAIQVVGDILDRMRRDHALYQDFAILYRTNAQSRALEEQLRRRNIPYIIYSGNAFFDRAEVKDVMAYFKLCVNPNDDESFKRTVNKPARAIGDTSVSMLNECARAHGCSLFKAAYQPDVLSFGLKPATHQKILAFCNMINAFAVRVRTTDAYELAKLIADESGIYAFYKSDNSIEGLARTQNVEELLDSVLSFTNERREEAEEELPEGTVFTLDDYLENVSLLSNADVSEDDSTNRVGLMTVHSAKGLEFPYVYITGLEENLFPSITPLSSTADIEEERRLFYVALTRAKRRAVLSYSSGRLRNGKEEHNSPSRFIKEIDPKYLENPLSEEDFSAPDPMGSFGSRFGRFGNARYGASGPAKTVRTAAPASRGGFAPSGIPSRPSRPGIPSKPAAIPARSLSASSKPTVIDPNFQAVEMTELFEGERIEHNRFGAGVIKSITGVVPELKAVINFDDYGEKLLLLKFAKLRPLKK